jgi:hypothetical protein
VAEPPSTTFPKILTEAAENVNAELEEAVKLLHTAEAAVTVTVPVPEEPSNTTSSA